MSVAETRWKIQLRQQSMAQQLAQSRRSRRETRYLLSNPANAARLRESIRELNQGRVIPVAFGPDGNLVRIDS